MVLEKAPSEYMQNLFLKLLCSMGTQKVKMEFWDSYSSTQKCNWEPKRLIFEEFAVPLIEVNLFCEAFGLQTLLLMALEDISKTKP